MGGILGGIAGAPEGGIGAIPGAAFGAGIGGYIGSRLDGEGIGQSALNGGCDAGLTYIGGEVGEAIVGRLGPILSKLPRPVLALRRGSISLPRRAITEAENTALEVTKKEAAEIVRKFRGGRPSRYIYDRATGKLVGEVTTDGSQRVIRYPHIDRGTPRLHFNLEDKLGGTNQHLILK